MANTTELVDSGARAASPSANMLHTRLPQQATDNTWGWFPAIGLMCSLGLLLLATANNAARVGAGWSAPLYWMSLLILYVPIALRLLARQVSRSERMALVTLAGVALYLVKVLLSPNAPSLHDEFLHLRTALDIAQTHHLFSPNPLYDVSPQYPGLEIVTNAVSSLSGLSLFGAGALVLGVARVMFVLALFKVYEMVGRSARLAGLATLFYMANPNFVYFDAQYAYESLALPLAIVALYFTIRRYRQRDGFRSPFTIAAIALTASLVVSHHMTSYAFLALLAVWWVIQALGRPGSRRFEDQILRWYKGESAGRSLLREAQTQLVAIRQQRRLRAHTSHARRSVGDLTLVTAILIALWLLTAGRQALATLGPIIVDDMVSLFQLLAAQEGTRTLFQTATGQIDPLWSRLLGYGSVALILVALPFGLWQVWRRYRPSALAMTLGLATLGYPLSLALRLTNAGVETSNRLSETLFVALGFVLAAAIVHLNRPQWPPLAHALRWGQVRVQRWKRAGAITHTPHPLGWRIGFAAAAAVLLLGGIVVGMPPYDLQPGSFHVAADARSNNQQSMLTAEWARTHLDPHAAMYTDLTNKLYEATYGRQNPIGHPVDSEEILQFMNSATFDAGMRQFLIDNQIKYVVIDNRLSTGLPWAGYYFESDPNAYNYHHPISPEGLRKFDHVPGMSRIYDNGTIVIYDFSLAPA